MFHKQTLLVQFIFVLLLPIFTTGQTYCSSVQNNSSSSIDDYFNNTQISISVSNGQSDDIIDNRVSVILCATKNANNISKDSDINSAITDYSKQSPK